MSDTPKLSDRDAFNIFVRAGQRRNKISWTPTGDQEDTDALNRAIRRAAGRDDPEEDRRPYPWTSLSGHDGNKSGGT
jgi:hypothetical protein